MDYILLDTNIIYADFKLKGRNFKDLSSYIEETNSKLVVPKIIFEEIIRNYSKKYNLTIQKCLKDLRQIGSESVEILSNLQEESDKEILNYKVYLENRLKDFNVLYLDYDKVEIKDLVSALLERKKPFKENGSGTGDWIIWKALKECVNFHGDTIFISENRKDFCEMDNSFSKDLKDEIKDATFSFSYYPDLNTFLGSKLPKVEGIDIAWLNGHKMKDIIHEEILERIFNMNNFFSEHYNNLFDEVQNFKIESVSIFPIRLYAKKENEDIVRISLDYNGKASVAFDFMEPVKIRRSFLPMLSSIDFVVTANLINKIGSLKLDSIENIKITCIS